MATAAPAPATPSRHNLIRRSISLEDDRPPSLAPIPRIPNQHSSSKVVASAIPERQHTSHNTLVFPPPSQDFRAGPLYKYDVASWSSSIGEEEPPPPSFIPSPAAPRFAPIPPSRPAPTISFRQVDAQQPLPSHNGAMVTNIQAPIARYRPTSSIESNSDPENSEDKMSTSTYYSRRRRAAMKAKMEKVWRRRSEIRNKRTELLRLFSHLESLYQQLPRPDMPRANNIEVLHDQSAQIHQSLGRLQAQREETFRTCRSLEEALMKEEDDIVREEAGIWLLTPRSFYGPSSGTKKSMAEDHEIWDSVATAEGVDPHRELLLGISADRPEDLHPLYRDLLEAVGDREIARESEEDLRMSRERILSNIELDFHRKRIKNNPGESISEEHLDKLKTSLDVVPTDAIEFKARFGVSICEDDLEFLRDYDCEIKRVQRNLEGCLQTVGRLRDLCEKKGVMRKHVSYSEEVTILWGSGKSLPPGDGNMMLEEPHYNQSIRVPSHPRFPILLSHPSHVLELITPQRALERALALRRDDPESAQRRAECMKELGITVLMKNVESKPDYINQWLIHRLRTSPLEAELMLTVFEVETSSKVVNLRRWQEDVLFHWRLDRAATMSPLQFDGPRTPIDEHGLGGQHGGAGKSGLGCLVDRFQADIVILEDCESWAVDASGSGNEGNANGRAKIS
ncbi:hypothetical protein QBC35DRAFT_448334 [Podospora australis]|uniref:Uncharacterized protein n=1 Tax=Podospora australis TaxID=1536484 RepID=A0AAN7ALS3_9PEZI|nr:hypothetical protein QBC35DRAFT_448334 [Podospora australis]